MVKESDLGNNFFVTAGDLGQSRAEVATRLLLELNPDVKGEALRLDIGEILTTAESGDLAFLRTFNLVIGSQLPQGQERRLSSLCAQLQTPLLLLKSVGLMASLRVYAPEHRIVESKPADKEVLDLHLMNPFPELRVFADSFDMATLDDMTHAHVPYVVLLIKLMDQWKGQHDGHIPTSFNDKTAFKATIKAASRNYFGESNFQEAFNNAYLSYADDIPDTTQAILSDSKASGNGSSSPLFWVAAEAVASFQAESRELPLSGALPDMTSTTDSYIQLQTIYQAKAKQDLEQVHLKVCRYQPED
jgi:amyloid beta precursor protein binding protein 1